MIDQKALLDLANVFLQSPKGKDLVAIYRRKPAAIITFKSGEFKRWIFEIKDLAEIEQLRSNISI